TSMACWSWKAGSATSCASARQPEEKAARTGTPLAGGLGYTAPRPWGVVAFAHAGALRQHACRPCAGMAQRGPPRRPIGETTDDAPRPGVQRAARRPGHRPPDPYPSLHGILPDLDRPGRARRDRRQDAIALAPAGGAVPPPLADHRRDP